MSILIRYNILFEVKILHHYFLNRGLDVYEKMTAEEQANFMLKYNTGDFFEIIPTLECRKTLNVHHCLFKTSAQGMIVGLRAQPDEEDPEKFRPYIPLDNDLEFTFLVYLRDYEFLNYTALPLADNEGRVYVFTNIKGNTTKQFPSLSITPPLFNNGKQYLPGDILSNNLANPTELYIAHVKTTSNTGTATDWLTEKKSDGFPMAYANSGDRFTLVRSSFTYTVKTADVEPSVTVKNNMGTTVTPRIVILPGEFRKLQVDMRDFTEGFYTMHLESAAPEYTDDISFFLIQEKTSPFGIIHLKVKSDVSQYDMVDAQGYLMNPAYDLRFRNRATHWRYLGNDFNENSVTKSPFPLTRHGFLENITVKDKNNVNVDDLPNPSARMVKTEAMVSNTEKRFFSEIHINKS
ncbi:MAG: hypothetical protein JXA03_15985 [Bacteroidales bacterium]|nr:hypothetical protein [Bacteroidales bacterium]